MKYYDLLKELVVRELKVRYCRPALGFFWAFLTPLLQTGVFYLIFSVFLEVRAVEIPFLLYIMSAVFSWRIFAESVTQATTCLVDNRRMLKETNFPHILVPLSITLAVTIQSLPGMFMLVVLSGVWLGGFSVLLSIIPVVLGAQLFLTAGCAILVALSYVWWRDMRYFSEIALMFLFYLTPCFYPLSIVLERFSTILYRLYCFNPLVGILTLYRAGLFRGFAVQLPAGVRVMDALSYVCVFSLAVFLISLLFYRSTRRTINDHLSY